MTKVSSIALITGIEEVDNNLNKSIENSMIVKYPDFFLRKPGVDIAVLSPIIKSSMKFQDLLYEIRKRDIRVILLAGRKDSEYIGYALALGIYDILFDPVDEEKIISKIKYPTQFSQISDLYVGQKGSLSFNAISENKKNIEENNKKNYTKENKSIPINDENILRKQLLGLFKLFNIYPKNSNAYTIPQLFSVLEKIIIQKVLEKNK